MAEHSAHQPDPHVGRNLVIPATTSVKLAANVFADDFRQSTLVRRMDILVIGFDVELSMCSVVLLAILPNSAKSRSSLRTLPFFHSSSTTRKPLSISACSLEETIPAFCRALENAIEPLTSAAYILLS
jgi:hypothetical protein